MIGYIFKIKNHIEIFEFEIPASSRLSADHVGTCEIQLECYSVNRETYNKVFSYNLWLWHIHIFTDYYYTQVEIVCVKGSTNCFFIASEVHKVCSKLIQLLR